MLNLASPDYCKDNAKVREVSVGIIAIGTVPETVGTERCRTVHAAALAVALALDVAVKCKGASEEQSECRYRIVQ